MIPSCTAADPGVTEKLAEFAATLEYDDLPPEVVVHAKRCVLDTIGCGLFGTTLPWSQILLQAVAPFGTGRSLVWGSRWTLPADLAALVNGTQVHGFELDDLHRRAIVHPGGVTIPAIVAMAEQLGADTVSGRDFLVAVVAGYEIAIRVGLGCGLGLLHQGWHNNGVLGTFGAAAGAGRLAHLDRAGMNEALGMAATQSSGLMSAQYDSMVKRMHAGRAAQSGLYAAQLTRHGFRGIRSVFEYPYGGFPAVFTEEYKLQAMIDGLGEQWEVARVGFKPYAACGSCHTSIDAILQLKSEHAFTSSQVEQCNVYCSTATRDHVGWPYSPGSATTAQMNLAYAIACAVERGRVWAAEFTPDVMTDDQILRLARRVHVEADPSIDDSGIERRHAVRLELTLTDGTVLTAAVEHAKGSDVKPLTDYEIEAKFRLLAGPVVGERNVDRLAREILNLDAATSVGSFLSLLVPPPPPVPVGAPTEGGE